MPTPFYPSMDTWDEHELETIEKRLIRRSYSFYLNNLRKSPQNTDGLRIAAAAGTQLRAVR
jgi:hypothetical protein